MVENESLSGPPSEPKRASVFTGYARKRATSRKVRIAERGARVLITVGGIGTIVAVTTICVFLLWVVVPLFRSGGLKPGGERALNGSAATRPAEVPDRLAVDEFRVLAWTLDREGILEVRRLDDGSLVDRQDLFESRATASAFGIGDGRVAFGFADGSTRIGVVRFVSELLRAEGVPPSLGGPGSIATADRAVFVRLPDGQVRRQHVTAQLDAPVAASSGSAVVLLDQSRSSSHDLLCVLRADGTLLMEEVTRTRNLLTDEEKTDVAEATLPFRKRDAAAAPAFLRISERGDLVYLAWPDGVLHRFDCRNLAKPLLAEVADLVPDPAVTLTSLQFLNGRSTLVAGDSAGGVRGWFPTKPAHSPNPDGIVLQAAHTLPPHDAAVTACAPSTRTRLFVTGAADGAVRVSQMTTGRIVAEARAGGPVRLVQLAPKNDGVVALLDGRLATFGLDAAHSEVTLRSMLLPVWYEGETEPAHVWQSAGATDDFEPKLGLVPLIFGTLKATFYSLLFSVPIALLAAIYTSEFLHPSIRSRVKPAIEMMASLPSVVLGFLAALVIAPFVEGIVPAMLLAFVAVPLGFLIGAFGWQMLPQGFTRRLQGWPKLLIVAALVPFSVFVAYKLGPVFERLFFHGDVKRWLDRQIGGSTGGWTLILLAPAAIATTWLFSRYVSPRLIAISADWGHGRSAFADFVKFAAGAICTVLIALAFGALFDAVGMDVRDSFFGTYSQRNALVVGFVMGFAVIPIIYTLAEDALSSVPVHLKSASLGCGATPWQTAIRVVLPTALSGIFSAVMVGLGRAVGETMVVLMAAGNTPVLEWNMFSGFRTLSANIATEMSEAVRGSTHYRMLFLAALSLFIITFLLNTFAELVRQRFRKRAYQL